MCCRIQQTTAELDKAEAQLQWKEKERLNALLDTAFACPVCKWVNDDESLCCDMS